MTQIRKFLESPLAQGAAEQIAYTFPTTPWGPSPSAVAVKAYDTTNGARTDVTATTLSGSPSVEGDVITLPLFGPLTARHLYRLEVSFQANGNTFVPYADIYAEE